MGYAYGMIGLGTMGRNLVMNMNDHGFSVAGYDKDAKQLDLFTKDTNGRKEVKAFSSLNEFIDSLDHPRRILLLVPAGPIVDAVINELKPNLSQGDLMIDLGNSHFTDTARRTDDLLKEGFHFLGAGISGGENGARKGPSIMPGGSAEDYALIRSMTEAIAAKADGKPCVAWMGPGAAGHFVKMVHNGIEYGIMQLIAETYHLLKKTMNADNDTLHTIFANWNNGKLHSYLVGITADIFLQQDDLTGNRLIDMILDSAGQKGTGTWTSESAMELAVPISIIDAAVATRDITALHAVRDKVAQQSKDTTGHRVKATDDVIASLENALYFSIMLTYAQGFSLLQTASAQYKYNLQLHEIASVWKGGCIIRSAMLDKIDDAFRNDPSSPNLVLDKNISLLLDEHSVAARSAIQVAVGYAVPVPAMMASLAYYDSFKSGWLPANLVQAQRDCFGAHTYKRTDREGSFHTQWNTNQS